MGTSPCNYFFGALESGLLVAGKPAKRAMNTELSQFPVIQTLASKSRRRVCENRARHWNPMMS